MPTDKLRFDQYFCLLFCLILILISGSLATQQWQQQAADVIQVTLLKPHKSISVDAQALAAEAETEGTTEIPQEASSSAALNSNKQLIDSPQQQITAQAYYILDLNSHSQLLAKNENTPLYPASTTKLMTALVARQQYKTHQVITAGQEAKTSGHIVGIAPGECLSVKSLLAAILINSGNDAAMILAEHHPFGYEGFIQDMNALAEKLTLSQTHFQNPMGFDDPQQQMSARDLAILSAEVYKDSLLAQMTNTEQMQITDLTGKVNHELINTNVLLAEENIHGLKTGTTDLAGEVLVTVWNYQEQENQEQPILIVVMNSQDRYADTKLLIQNLQQSLRLSEFDVLN